MVGRGAYIKVIGAIGHVGGARVHGMDGHGDTSSMDWSMERDGCGGGRADL